MPITTSNGMTVVDDLGSRPDGPGIIQQLGNEVDAFYGSKVATAADLPGSGEFAGQRVWLVDVKRHATWNGSAWSIPQSYEVVATSTNVTGTSPIDIAGLSQVVVSSGTSDVFTVAVSAEMRLISASAASYLSLLVDSNAQPRQIAVGGAAGTYFTAAKVWKITGLAAGNHTIKVRGSNFATATCEVTTNSQMNIDKS
jgi:hypothetical protein